MKYPGILFLILTQLLLGVGSSRAAGLGSDSASGVSPLVIPQLVYNPVMLPVQEHEIKAGLLYDAVNHKIVWQKNMDAMLPIASLTKMMVALLTVEDIRAGKYTWNDNVHWVRQLASGRRRHRRITYANADYTLRDVFKATMIASNNECAEQMARYIGNGDLAATIQRMNARARQLGMNNTYYGNPSGLPAPRGAMDNSSTPIDQLLLGLELLKYDEVLDITGMGYAEVRNGTHPSIIRNHNGLAIQHTGEVDGLKTGYTRRAGFCLVGTSYKCDHRLISVVLGCRGPQIRNEVVRNMFNAYYTSIGVDPIGNYCGSPTYYAGTNTNDSSFSVAGQWVTIQENVRKSYVVRSGDNLSRIASKNHCSTAQIRKWNKGKIPSSGSLKAGQRLTVYTKTSRQVWVTQPANGTEEEEDSPASANASDTPSENKAIKPVTVSPENKAVVYHVVAPGDTLFSIARKYGDLTVDQLKSMNNISDSRNLKPGMKLKVRVDG